MRGMRKASSGLESLLEIRVRPKLEGIGMITECNEDSGLTQAFGELDRD